MTSTRYDVFVSYRWVEPDQTWVRQELVPALRSAGLKVCLDVEDFVPGRDLMLEMDRAGAHSGKAICVLSPDYFRDNRMVGFESLMARRLDPSGMESRLIPLTLRQTSLPEWIRGLIPIDWTEALHHDREWKKLLRVLGARTLNGPRPASLVVDRLPKKRLRDPSLRPAFTVGCYNYPPFETWKTASSGSFRPGTLTNEGSKHYGGPWFRVMESLAAELRFQFSFGPMTSIALTDLATWNYDFIPGVFRTRQREQHFDFSIPIHRIGLQGVCKAGRHFTKEQLLRGKYRIVVQPGEVGWEYVKAEFPRAFASGQIFQVSSEQTGDVLNMLVSNQYDLAIGDEISCLHFVRNPRWRGQFVLAFSERLQVFDAGIALRKSLGMDLERLNQALRKVRSEHSFLSMEGKALRGFENIERCSVDWK